MKQRIGYLLFLFAVGSVAGWCMEVLFRSAECQKLITSGFLKGPYCPIYGMGIVSIVLLCSKEQKIWSFFKIFILCSLLEYVISWVCENWFHVLLWDYSLLPFSLGTRVNLFFSVCWGVLGLWFLCCIEPVLQQWFFRRRERFLGMGIGVTALIGIDWLMNVLLVLLY